MKLVGLPKGGQKAIHGSAVNVPSKLQPVVCLLPRLPDTTEVLPLKLKRKLSYKGHYIHEYIRPKRVMEALQWLKHNNPLYKDITISIDWEDEWEVDDPDLWTAMTAVFDEVENGSEQVSSAVVDDASSLSAQPSRLSPLPAGDDYAVLSAVARGRNLAIQDVPGDGDCLLLSCRICITTCGWNAKCQRARHTGSTRRLLEDYGTEGMLPRFPSTSRQSPGVTNTQDTDTEAVTRIAVVHRWLAEW